jgi:hypothetical protein
MGLGRGHGLGILPWGHRLAGRRDARPRGGGGVPSQSWGEVRRVLWCLLERNFDGL